MTLKFPTNNLPPESQRWAREVENFIRDNDRRWSSESTFSDNTNKGMSASLTAIGKQIAALNKITEELVETQNELIATQAQLAAQTEQLIAQQNYLAGLITRSATALGFNTGTLAADNTIHYVGPTASININCTTGKLLVSMSCPEASIQPGSGSGVSAYMSFAISGVSEMGDVTTRVYTGTARIGATLNRQKAVTMPPGHYTVTVQRGYWCASGNTGASIDFANAELIVTVINND